ncbi:MAG: methionyl-tRNA formyltransferase [Rhodospirillales bacterium]|nr:methionyl-tRNA formyltransferase [Rhodospirillales bacterium]
MPKEIVLLTGDAEAPHLTGYLREHAAALPIRHVRDRRGLEAAIANPSEGVRLIAFSTAVIVPATVLKALGSPAYNFHPGPPTYPGSHGVEFALYEGADRFGATAHVMRPKVDEGPIVGVEWFDILPQLDRTGLEIKAYGACARLFLKLARALATGDAPLPEIGVAWSGPKRTNRDYEQLREITPELDAEEAARRKRAFG